MVSVRKRLGCVFRKPDKLKANDGTNSYNKSELGKGYYDGMTMMKTKTTEEEKKKFVRKEELKKEEYRQDVLDDDVKTETSLEETREEEEEEEIFGVEEDENSIEEREGAEEEEDQQDWNEKQHQRKERGETVPEEKVPKGSLVGSNISAEAQEEEEEGVDIIGQSLNVKKTAVGSIARKEAVVTGAGIVFMSNTTTETNAPILTNADETTTNVLPKSGEAMIHSNKNAGVVATTQEDVATKVDLTKAEDVLPHMKETNSSVVTDTPNTTIKDLRDRTTHQLAIDKKERYLLSDEGKSEQYEEENPKHRSILTQSNENTQVAQDSENHNDNNRKKADYRSTSKRTTTPKEEEVFCYPIDRSIYRIIDLKSSTKCFTCRYDASHAQSMGLEPIPPVKTCEIQSLEHKAGFCSEEHFIKYLKLAHLL